MIFYGENNGYYSKPCATSFTKRNRTFGWRKQRAARTPQKSGRADASMTGVNAMRSHDMTVMYEPLSKPQSKMCKLSLQADSGKAQVQFSDAQGREETDHGETTIKTML